MTRKTPLKTVPSQPQQPKAHWVKKHEKGWKISFNAVMKQHNRYTADGGKACSYATQRQRGDVLLQGFRDLRKHGFKFTRVEALKGKHIRCLVEQWKDQGLSASTVQNRLSIFRTFATWIGKQGMVRELEHYLGQDHGLKRTYAAVETRSWSGVGIDANSKINVVRGENRRFGDALALQHAFGLRSKESLLMKPHLADKGQVLVVLHGTKGGRTRYVPIETEEQRQLLENIKGYVKPGESLVPRGETYAQCRNRYYYILRKHGIKRDEGITAHGLRHEHLQKLYTAATGHEPAVRGGKLHKTDKVLDSFARELVAERAGHTRESISAAYLGGKQNPGTQTSKE